MDNITRVSLEYVPEAIKKEFGDAAILMNGALNFVNNIERIVNRYEHLNKEISFFAKPLSNLGQAMLRNKDLLRQAISQQYLFEQKVNQFLGRTINFAWVDAETGEVLFTDEVHAKDIYMQADTQAGKSRTSARAGKIYANVVKNSQEVSRLPNFVEEQYRTAVEKRLNQHQALLKEILDRWNANHNEKNVWAKEHYNTVYWRHPPKGIEGFHHPVYAWSEKVNRGHISQEYVNFIFNQMQNLSLSEFGIGTFMMRTKGKKDQIPGIVKGDIVIKDNQNVQIAVKSDQFDTASIGPYLRVAFQIIAFYDEIQDLTIDEVEKILSNTKRYNQKITQAGRKKAQEIIEKTAKQTGAKVF